MRLLRVVLVLAVLGCAGRNTSSSLHVDPPQLVGRSSPDFRFPPGPPRAGVLLDVRLEVLVDALGQPDLQTLRLTGTVSSENRDAIVEWVRTARFRPGRQAGVPVAATYRGDWRIEARAAVIRSLED